MQFQYPLEWPDGWQETEPNKRKRARYLISFEQAQCELADELRLLDRKNEKLAIVSTNIPTRRDGKFYATAKNPDNPGVSVFFRRGDAQHVIACDTWDYLKDNLRAVSLAITAMRQLERCGASVILDRAFSGFAALPAPDWRATLGVPSGMSDYNEVLQHYRIARAKEHPDRGGDPAKFDAIEKAWEQAKRELA